MPEGCRASYRLRREGLVVEVTSKPGPAGPGRAVLKPGRGALQAEGAVAEALRWGCACTSDAGRPAWRSREWAVKAIREVERLDLGFSCE